MALVTVVTVDAPRSRVHAWPMRAAHACARSERGGSLAALQRFPAHFTTAAIRRGARWAVTAVEVEADWRAKAEGVEG
jgi:hypothetical protein